MRSSGDVRVLFCVQEFRSQSLSSFGDLFPQLGFGEGAIAELGFLVTPGG